MKSHMSSDVIFSNLHILIQDVIFDVLLPLGTPSPLCVITRITKLFRQPFLCLCKTDQQLGSLVMGNHIY